MERDFQEFVVKEKKEVEVWYYLSNPASDSFFNTTGIFSVLLSR